MTLIPEVHHTPDELGAAAARLVADRFEAAGPRFVLGCPGGRSAATTYAALATELADRRLDLSQLVILMMDDYLVTAGNGQFRREDPHAPHSCERFGQRDIIGQLNAAVRPHHRIPLENLWLPDPADPAAYDERITAHGGVDVFLLATGASDGHIAFNPPGSSINSRTRIVRLPDTTRRDNLSTFPTFEGELDRVPTHGVTVGLGTIKDNSREVVMLVHGSDKQYAVQRLVTAEGFDPEWPATVFRMCARPHLLVDINAFPNLTAITR